MNKFVVKVDADLEDLIPGFLDNREKDIGLLKEHLTNNNYEAIRIIGHSMKGFGAGYGFDEISILGAELEQAAKKNNSLDIATLIDKLQEYMESIEIIFEEM